MLYAEINPESTLESRYIESNPESAFSGMESKVVVYLLQELFDDMAKRNLLPHKQFLLQRYFGFTGNKTQTGRTPINPFKLKGFLLHLPEPQSNNKSDWV